MCVCLHKNIGVHNISFARMHMLYIKKMKFPCYQDENEQ